MRDFSKKLIFIAGALVFAGTPADASSFWEDLFGGSSRRSDFQGMGDANRASPPRRARAPRASRTANPDGFVIHNRIRVTVTHSSDREADPIVQDYLRSQDFTKRFASGAPDDTREAVAFMLKNDATLQPGDAIVTHAGVLVLDGDKRRFAPAAHAFDRSLRERLMAFAPTNAAPRQRAAEAAEPAEAKQPLAFSVRVGDGQLIRYVGGM